MIRLPIFLNKRHYFYLVIFWCLADSVISSHLILLSWLITWNHAMITSLKNIRYIVNYSECIVSTFRLRAFTLYDKFLTIWPNLICLEGPYQFPSNIDVRVVNTLHPDRLNIWVIGLLVILVDHLMINR